MPRGPPSCQVVRSVVRVGGGGGGGEGMSSGTTHTSRSMCISLVILYICT